MKSLRILGVLGGLLIAACGGTKIQQDVFPYDQAWELEYLDRSGLGLEALFPDRNPYLIFESGSGQVVGNSGCNGYTAPFEQEGARLSFGQPGPSTLMYCGEGEPRFRELLQQVNHWKMTPEGQLALYKGEDLLMRFKAIPKPQ